LDVVKLVAGWAVYKGIPKILSAGRKTTQAVQACVEALVDAARSPDWFR
jgi:hypothetical protein